MSIPCCNCEYEIEPEEIDETYWNDFDLLCVGPITCPKCGKSLEVNWDENADCEGCFWTEGRESHAETE